MSASTVRFELVGYRFDNLIIDEARFENDKPTASLEVAVGADDPQVSAKTMKGRPVIELSVFVNVSLSQPEGKKISKDKREMEFISARCTAGFVGANPKNDGDLHAFGDCSEPLARSMYWLVRQRIVSLLTMTRFRSVQLPWDVEANNDRTEKKPPARKVKASPKKKK